MQDDVVYSEVVFIRKEECKQENSNADVSAVGGKACSVVNTSNADDRHEPSNAKSDSRASLHCALLMLLTLCVLLLGAVTALTLLYMTAGRQIKESPLLQNRRENQTAYPQPEYCQRNLSNNMSQACPKDWEYYSGKCYFFSEDCLNWTQSRDNCISIGGHLVIINTKDEQEFLMKLLTLKMENGESKFWIGLTDEQTEDLWLWVDNTLLDHLNRFWEGKEPDNWSMESSDGENCACMEKNTNSINGWFDNACKMRHRRICETKSPNQA